MSCKEHQQFREALQAIDEVNLNVVFQRRANVMKSVPHILTGPFRNAMKVLLEEVLAGHERGDILRQERGWKAFMLLPRLLLHRKCRGGKVGKEKLRERFDVFQAGGWASLLTASVEHDEEAARIATRKRRTHQHGDLEHRIGRALTRIQLGELTAGRQALEGADLAPGTEATLRQLRQRPQVPRDPIPVEHLRHVPRTPFALAEDKFGANLRSSRRGTAGGPSGMTNEHLRPLLDSERDMHLFFRVAELLARGDVPENVASVLRKGRLTALQKPGGGVRGMAGDVIRRLVARTVAQQLGKAVEQATAPYQYALPTRAGCECVAHALQAFCDLDPKATVVSIDGISAYDLISRRAMLSGLAGVEGGAKVLPFVNLFYGSPSTYWWEDAMGTVHEVHQGEGGEQGDAMMPLLFSFGQTPSLGSSEPTVESRRIALCLLGRRVCRLQTSEGGSGAHIARTCTLGARPHPSARWENEGVEPGRCEARGMRFPGETSPVGRGKCQGLERRRRGRHGSAGDQDLGNAARAPRFCP